MINKNGTQWVPFLFFVFVFRFCFHIQPPKVLLLR